MKTIQIVGKPLGLRTGMLDTFVEALPTEKRGQVFKTEKQKLKKILKTIYKDPHIAGIGSHLQIVATKNNN